MAKTQPQIVDPFSDDQGGGAPSLYDPAPRPKKQAIVDPFEQPQNKATTKIVDPFAKAQPKQAAPEAKGGGVMETLGEVAPTVGSTAASAAQATGHIAGGLADVPSSVDRWMDLGNQIAERNNVPDWANPFIALGKVTSTLSEGIDIGDYHAAGTKELGETITQGWKHIGNLLDPQDRRKKNTKKLQDSFDKMISGEGAEDFVQDATNPEILLNNLGQAAPSLYAAIKSGGAPAFIALLETSETEQGAQEFEERTGQEVDPEDFAMAQAQVGLLNTWLERIVPKSIADKLANRSSEKVGGFLRRLWRAFREGGKESGTELVQEWNQNLAQGRFNPEQQATEGLPHAAFGGFGAGTAMRGTAEVLDAASPDNQGPSGDDISGDVDPTQSIFDPETLQPEPGGDEDTMSGVDLTGGAVDEAIDLSGGVMGDEDIQVEEVDYEDIDLSGADTLDTEGMLDIETAVDEAPEQEALRPDEVDRTIAALEGELEKPEIVDPFAGEPEDAQLDTEAIEVEEIQPETVTMREPESVEELDAQAMEAAESPQTDIPEPTEAQKEAGNYKKGKVRLNGMEISIENPRGSTRRGTSRSGEKWSQTMKDHYGYIRGTKGKDKDHIDVFVTKDGHDTSRPVFVVDQVNKDGSFDEHKIVMGAANEKQARRVYKRNYGKDWQGLGAIKQMSQDEFKGWLEGDTTKPVALPVAKKRTTVSEKRTARQDDEVTILSDKRPAPPSLKTSKNIPNRESISATLDDPEEMGVQEFSTKEFAGGARDVFANAKDVQRSRELAEEIRKSGVIDPLIVALDESGEPTILEGAHRLGALAELGVEKFPALVVRERHQDEATEEATTAKPVEPKKPAEDQADMLPAPTTGEQVRKAKTDRKQAQQTSPDMDKGEGDLFSDKSKQKDVEDVAKKPAKTDKLEDFGEVLEGARKHYAQKLKDAESLDVAVEPLSKTWPEPNYQQLLDEGNDPWIVGFIHASRDEIPRKPVKSWKLKRWIEDVEALRNLSHRLLNGEVELDHAQISLENMPRLHEQISGRIDLYQAIGHERSLKGVKFGVSRYSMYNRQKFDPPKEVWEVTKAAKATAFGNMPRVIASGDTKDQAIKQFKKVSGSGALDQSRTKTVRFDIYHKRSDPGTVFIGKKVGRDYVDLETFDSAEAAREYLAKNQDALEKKLAKLKEIPDHRKESNSPRVGADHRNGADVTPEQFTETFGFRGVQFGNYVEGPRRQEDLNETYDALLDLAGILNLPPKSLSLNGELGLAFGARGKGGKRAAKAHFEPDNIVINLTKRKGAGSLAHEWWHSLDNYFARQRGGRSYLTETADQRGEGVRPEMVEAFKNVTQAINRTKLRERSKKLDQTRTEPYWQTGREMSARSFESYVIERLRDQEGSNDYLANIVSKDYWDAAAALGLQKEGTYPYPEAAEMPEIRAVFDNFFQVVETRETDKGTGLFSIDTPSRQRLNTTLRRQQSALNNLTKAWNEVQDTIESRNLDELTPLDVILHGETMEGSVGPRQARQAKRLKRKVERQYLDSDLMRGIEVEAVLEDMQGQGPEAVQQRFRQRAKAAREVAKTAEGKDEGFLEAFYENLGETSVPTDLGETDAAGVQAAVDLTAKHPAVLTGPEANAWLDTVLDTIAGRDAGPLYSFAGTRARTANIRSRYVASERIRAGEDAEAVRKDTGWFVGDDGKWRFEIDDSDARLVGTDKPFSHLGTVLEHDRLFEAYPGLSGVGVTLAIGPKVAVERGMFQQATVDGIPVGPHITVHAKDRKTALSILLHETQHAIQSVEGFATGGSQSTVRDMLKSKTVAEFERVDREYREIGQEIPEVLATHTMMESARHGIMSELGLDPLSRNAVQAMKEGATAEQKARMKRWQVEYNEAVENAGGFENETVKRFVDAATERERVRQKYDISEDQAFNEYTRLAGEVEARNVQTRQGLSPKSRRAVSPETTRDVPASDVLVAWNGQEMESAPDPIQTEAFKRWFDGSKIVDENGEPLVVYHGTPSRGEYSNNPIAASEQSGIAFPVIDEFDTKAQSQTDSGWLGRGTYFTPDPGFAEEFGDRIMPVYLKVERPFEITDDGSTSRSNVFRFLQSLQGLEGLPEDMKLDLSIPKNTKEQFRGEEIALVWHLNQTEGGYSLVEEMVKPGQNPRGGGVVQGQGQTKEEAIFNYRYKYDFPGFLLHIIGRQIGSQGFSDLLQRNGYDGVIERNTDGEISEVVVFEPTQIKSAVGNRGTFDPSDPSILKAAGRPSGMTPAEARTQIEDRFGKPFLRKLERTGKFSVLNNQRELDMGTRRRLFGENLDARPAGLRDPRTGESWIFAENIGNNDAVGVFLHEVGAHYGMPQMLGEKDYRNVKKRLRQLAETDERVKMAIWRVPDNTADEHFWDEVLAYLVQHNYQFQDSQSAIQASKKDKLVRLLRQVLAKIRAFLSRNGMLQAKDLSVDDVVELTKGAARRAPGFAVMEQGQPLFAKGKTKRLYRGASRPVEGATWFTPDRTAAKEYSALDEGGQVIQRDVALGKMAEPADLRRIADQLGLDHKDQADYWLVTPDVYEGADQIIAELKRQGYDSVHMPKGQDFSPEGRDIESHLVFDPPQQGMFAQAPPTDTEAFRRWFKDSKVVDENGEPLVVYHGSPDVRGILKEGFTSPEERLTGERTGGPYFFVNDKAVAETYADDSRAFDYQNAEPATLSVYLSIKNPMEIDARGETFSGIATESVVKAVASENEARVRDMASEGGRDTTRLRTDQVAELAKEFGHDGVIVRNVRDNYMGKGRPSTVYMTFDSAQAKSAMRGDLRSRVDGANLGNVENRGTFDPSDPNILHSEDRESSLKKKRAQLRRMGLDFNNLPDEVVENPTRPTKPVDEVPEEVDPETAREQLKDRGMFATAPPTQYSEQNRRLREQDKTVWRRAKRVLRRQLSPGGLLPRSVFDEKITRDSQFEVIEFDVRHIVGNFERAIKRDHKRRAGKLTEGDKKILSDALSGKELPEGLNSEVRTAVTAMRSYIDKLSREYAQILDRQVSDMRAQFDEGRQILFDAMMEMQEIVPASNSSADKAKATRRRNEILVQAKEQAKEVWGNGRQMQAALAEVNDAASRASLLQTVAGNVGKYVHRSYQAFDDPNWINNVPEDVLDRAREYLAERNEDRAEALERNAQELYELGHLNEGQKRWRKATELRENADTIVERQMNEILKVGTAFDSMEAFIKEGKLGRMDMSVLQHRKEVPKAIRDLLGEYSDPRINFSKSATKMGRLIWNQRFLEKIQEVGEGTFLWRADDESRPAEAYVEIAAETAKNYEPLSGYYTYPEIEQAFRDALGKEQMADWYRWIVQLNGMVKYGKTVLSPTTAARNWQSAAFFSLANGHINWRHMEKSVGGMREYFTQQGKGGRLKYLRKLKELGVVYDTPYAGEMMRLLDDSQMNDRLLSGGGQMAWGDALQYATKFYQFGDDFWKIIGFENEKALLMKHAGMEEQAAEIEAAERIRNTYPTYSMVGRFVKNLRRFPLVGTFVSFPAEIIRTSYHMTRYVAKDWNTPGMRPIAARRALGLATVAAFAHALQALSRAWFDIDDEEEDALRVSAAPWQKNSNFLYLGRDDEGNIVYEDVSFIDPYNIWKRPITAALRNEPWQDRLTEALGDTLGPFLGTDIAFGAITEVVYNKRHDTGGPVWKEHDFPQDQLMDMVTHISESLQPGLTSNMFRTWKAIQGEKRASGRQYQVDEELAAWFGHRVSTLEPKISVKYRTYDFVDQKRTASSKLSRVLQDPNEVSEDEIEDAVRDSLTLRNKAYEDMIRMVHAAKKVGATRREIEDAMRSSGAAKRDALSMLEGRWPEYNLSRASETYALRNARALHGEEHAEEIHRRYNLARDAIREREKERESR